MKKVIFTFILILLCSALFFGIGLIFLPSSVNYTYTKSVENEYDKFQEEVKQIKTNNKKVDEEDNPLANVNLPELKKAMEAYNTSLLSNQVLSSSDYNAFSVYRYGVYDGIIGYIHIPRLDVVMPIRVGGSSSIINQGSGCMTGSSLPVANTDTHTIIVAHRGWGGRQMLRHIERLENGDRVYIDNIFGERLEYEVIKSYIIPKGSTEGLYIERGHNFLSLYTCHPYTVNTHRYIVTCKTNTSLS